MSASTEASSDLPGVGSLPADEAHALRHITDLSVAEEWEAMPAALQELRGFAQGLPQGRQAIFLRAALELIETLKAQALERRREDATRLTTMHTGKLAAQSYRSVAPDLG